MSEGSRKIFVGGLAWQTTEDNLKFHFERYGPIESVTIMTDRATGNPRGFGFVSFVDAATVDLVCQEKHLLNDKYIDVKKAQDRSTAPPSIHGQEGRPDAAAQSRYDDPSQGQENKLFVGGLGQAITEQALGEYFGKFGELASVAIMKDSATQRSRGFGELSSGKQGLASSARQRTRASAPLCERVCVRARVCARPSEYRILP